MKTQITVDAVRNEDIKKGDYYLCIAQCPVHKNFVAITIDDWAGGKRLTPSKCCGRWDMIKSWKLDKRVLNGIIEVCQSALDAMGKEVKNKKRCIHWCEDWVGTYCPECHGEEPG